jgi:hypothetical protein
MGGGVGYSKAFAFFHDSTAEAVFIAIVDVIRGKSFSKTAI